MIEKINKIIEPLRQEIINHKVYSVIKDKDDSERAIGSMVKVKVAKNKLAPPFRVAEFEMTYGTGISRVGEAVDLGAQFGVLTKSGAFYSIHDAQLVNTINTEYTAAAAAAKIPTFVIVLLCPT